MSTILSALSSAGRCTIAAMTELPFPNLQLDDLLEFIRDPASDVRNRLTGEAKKELMALASYGQAEGKNELDFRSHLDNITMTTWRPEQWTPDDVRKGIQRLGLTELLQPPQQDQSE